MTLTEVPDVVEIDALELKARLDAGEFPEFFDVRTHAERDIAQIGARLLDQAAVEYIESLHRSTPLVFH